FIIHVDIPADIETAWQVLQADTTLRNALDQRALR
ncbi:YdcF family protein, partial [Salmonella enterica]|nr:YdcF family protein [Salmonella enterica]